MPLPPEIFEDPRSKPRTGKPDPEIPTGKPDHQPSPAAEEDWYLKRKPVVAYIGPRTDNKNINT